MAQAITLDNILSAAFFFLPKWTPALKRNQSRDLLRLLVCKLYGSTKGQNLFHARVRASHEALAADLGLSREWTCKLLARLREEGWLSYSTVRLPDGKFEIGTFLLFWLTITFASFGLFAPRNATVLAVLFVCALSVGSAIFLVLEMETPFDGVLRVSAAPMRYAYAHLNQ